MNTVLVELPPTPPQAIPSKRSVRKKRVRIIKKIRSAKGVWKFISWIVSVTGTSGTSS